MKSEEEARERVREAVMERSSRIRDSKQTHIVLGFDSAPKLSEKVRTPSLYALIFLGFCDRWRSMERKELWIQVFLRLANPMDPLRDTLSSVTSEPLLNSLITYTHRRYFRCGAVDGGQSVEEDDETLSVLQGVLQQRNFLKYVSVLS